MKKSYQTIKKPRKRQSLKQLQFDVMAKYATFWSQAECTVVEVYAKGYFFDTEFPSIYTAVKGMQKLLPHRTFESIRAKFWRTRQEVKKALEPTGYLDRLHER